MAKQSHSIKWSIELSLWWWAIWGILPFCFDSVIVPFFLRDTKKNGLNCGLFLKPQLIFMTLPSSDFDLPLIPSVAKECRN